jgi:hypothetical protein
MTRASWRMKRLTISIFTLVAGSLLGTSLTAKGATPPERRSERAKESAELTLDPAKAPSPVEWRRFMEMPVKEIEALWLSNAHRGNHLAAWDWKWRLGWVRVCAGENSNRLEFCQSLLEGALDDKALVVRAESAAAIGTILEGSKDPSASRKLLTTLRDEKNTRRGTPVMVQKRALYSILKIGHPDSIKEAGQLAAMHPDLKSYWEKLTST